MVEIDNRLIIKLNFPSYEDLTYEEKLERLMDLETLHLEWAQITRIDNLELFSRIKTLHLQHNQIQAIENLEFLTDLEYLSLAGNLITRVCGLRTLSKLLCLNLADNQIGRFDLREIPEQVALLSVKGNPGSTSDLTRQILIKFEMLEDLDGHAVTDSDRFEALGFKAKRSSEEEVAEPAARSAARDVDRFMTEPEDYDELTVKTQEILKHTRRRFQGLIERKEYYVKRLGQLSSQPK